MELRSLRYFLAVVEERHLTRAAEALGIRPTSLSQQIIGLERDLDTSLFVRTAGGMVPTAAADRLVPHALAAVAAARRAAESVRTRPLLHVAVTPGAPPWVVAELWRATADFAPEFTDTQTGEQLVRLRNGALDLGLLLMPEDLTGLDHITIAEAELGAVVAVGHRLAGRTAVQWADLHPSSVLWFSQPCAPGYHQAIQQHWLRAGWRPSSMRNGSPRRALFVAELSGGDDVVALRPAWDVRDGDGLVWIPFASDAPRIRHALAWSVENPHAAKYATMAADLACVAVPHKHPE
ncbi:LysR family transcriptional regulator [Nocardia sp. NPDC058519]|uniref:LysR family transcriptional regulator n=1 Tax=Nocardia sp. NPDC058519 TaxID=3346535 RepID=UPI00365BF290